MSTAVPNPSDQSTEAATEPRYTAHEDSDSGLERLPAETRRKILAVSDLPCLRALVRASPIFHQQYLLDRGYILAASLDVTLRSVSVDAYTVQKARNHALTNSDHFTDLLETWRANIRQSSSWQLKGAVTEDEAVLMVSFHSRIVVPIARQFAAWALDEFTTKTKEFKTEQDSQPELSIIEWQRCLRAAYRFELLCHVAYPTSPVLRHEVASDNAIALFGSLEPWEVEELSSFYQFAAGVHDKIFDDLRGELHPEHPRFADQDRPPTPDGAFEFDNEWKRGNFVEGTTLHGGLGLLNTVLFVISYDDRERLVTTMQRSIVSSYIPICGFEGILGEMQQSERRKQNPSPGDWMTEHGTPLPFSGDDPGAPPLAWTLIWGGTYSNLYGEYTSDHLRRWAYVFWDSSRLQKQGGKDLLARQWEEAWLDDHPRRWLLRET